MVQGLINDGLQSQLTEKTIVHVGTLTFPKYGGPKDEP